MDGTMMEESFWACRKEEYTPSRGSCCCRDSVSWNTLTFLTWSHFPKRLLKDREEDKKAISLIKSAGETHLFCISTKKKKTSLRFLFISIRQPNLTAGERRHPVIRLNLPQPLAQHNVMPSQINKAHILVYSRAPGQHAGRLGSTQWEKPFLDWQCFVSSSSLWQV